MGSPSTTGRCPCKIKPSPVQIIMDSKSDSVSEIVTKYRRKVRCEARKVVRSATCYKCGTLVANSNFEYTQEPEAMFSWIYKLDLDEILIGLIILILFFAIVYCLYLTRRYTRVRIYGDGGCVSTFFWTYDHCTVIY